MRFFLRKHVFAAGVILVGVSLACGQLAMAQSAAPQARVVSAPQNDKMVALRGNIHPMARPANDRGILQDQQPVTRIHLLLQRSTAQEAALQQLMADQLDAKSARFHAWLTPQEFGAQFGPADSDVQAVKSWLAAQGFTGLKVNNGKTLIEFAGTAGQVRNAFRTEVHRLSVNGEEHFANMQEPQIPGALAPVVKGVVGLHNFHPKSQMHRLGKFKRNATTGEVAPLFTFSDVNGTFYGVGPTDFAKIYNTRSAGFDGTGVSIAIVGQSNIDLQDVTDFRNIFGLTPYTYSLNANCPASPCLEVITNGPDPGLVSGDEGESDLDVEWSGAVAPGANIIFVTTEFSATDGFGGVDSSAEYIVDNSVAPIMSESYGSCEANLGSGGNAFYSALWQQAAAEGITVVVSAGDNGSAGCDDPNSENSATLGLGVSGLASTPYNVAMGGTDFNQSGLQTNYWVSLNSVDGKQLSAKGYIPEMVWNDSCASTATPSALTVCASATTTSTTDPLNIVAGSGAPSAVYAKPAWQASGITGMPADGKRDLPDVSLFSATGRNKSFFIVCESDQDITGDTGCNLTTFSTTAPFHDFQAVGGTSAAAPSFAAIMALINQKTGQRQGNANVELYALAKTETFSSCDSGNTSAPSTCIFHDITSSNSTDNLTPNLNNSVPCAGASTNCSKTTASGIGVLISGGNPAFTAGVGYDLATGLGSVNATNLINGWTTASATGTVPTVTLSPASVTGTAGTVSGNLTGTVTGSGGTPTGIVILENATTNAPLTSTVLSSGAYTIPAALLPGASATYTVKAHYSGDATFAPKDSGTISVTLIKQASKVLVSFVTFDASNNPILNTSSQSVQYGSPYILRIDVTNAGGTACQDSSGNVNFICPTGSVSLLDGGNPLKDFPNAQTANASSNARLNDRGFAEDQPIQLNVGPHPITATYAADLTSSYNSSAASNTLSVTITQATTTTAVVPSTTIVASGGSVTLTATVSSNSNSSQGPTGTVQFLSGSANLGTAATCTPTGFDTTTGTSAFCTATLTTTISSLPPGFYTPAPRNTPFVIVTWLSAVLAAIGMLLALRMAERKRKYAYAGLALMLIAAAAIAGCSGSSGGGGGGGSTRSLTAHYSGDTNYAASTSPARVITVQ